jgi:hypothetical protein
MRIEEITRIHLDPKGPIFFSYLALWHRGGLLGDREGADKFVNDARNIQNTLPKVRHKLRTTNEYLLLIPAKLSEVEHHPEVHGYSVILS